MTRRVPPTLLFVLALALLLPDAAAAQTGVDALAPGDTIRLRHVVETLRSRGSDVVNSTSRRTHVGELVTLDADSLVLHAEYALVRVPRSAIRELSVRRGARHGSAARGALWGGVVGAAAGATLLGWAGSGDDGAGYGTTSNWAGAGAGAGLLLGAGIGAVVNRMRSIPNWQEVEVSR